MPKDQEPQIIDVEPTGEGDGAAPRSEQRSIALPRDVLPETLVIVPAFERPLFPKMMGPVLIAGEGLKRAVAEALSAIAQQPDESNTITRTLFVGLAMIESFAIYCFVVAMILIFANPFWDHVVARSGG